MRAAVVRTSLLHGLAGAAGPVSRRRIAATTAARRSQRPRSRSPIGARSPLSAASWPRARRRFSPARTFSRRPEDKRSSRARGRGAATAIAALEAIHGRIPGRPQHETPSAGPARAPSRSEPRVATANPRHPHHGTQARDRLRTSQGRPPESRQACAGSAAIGAPAQSVRR